jgi:hypothetical protein
VSTSGSTSITRGFIIFGRILHFLFSVIVIFLITYLLGHSILSGTLKGNDSPLHVGYAFWLDQYFPDIPHWYPLQGGGQSLLHGYPIASHLLIVILQRFSNLSLVETFRVITFLSFPLTAIGIYILGWVIFRRQTIALIGSVLYLMPSITWTMTYDWGFLAQSVAMIFLPLGILSFERYFHYRLNLPKSGIRQIWLTLSVFILVITMLTHVVVGAGIVGAMILIIIVTAIFAKSGERYRIFGTGLQTVLYIGIIAAMVLAFYLVPFYRYGQIANRGGLNLAPLHQLNRIPILEFFGLKASDPLHVLTRMANPLVTIVFFIIGIPLALRYSRKGFVFGIVAILASIYSLVPELSFMLRKISASLAMLYGLRSMLVVSMTLLPICAGFGFWAVTYVLFSPKSLVKAKSNEDLVDHPNRNSLVGFIHSIFTTVVAAIFIFQLGKIPTSKLGHLTYGPLSYGIDLGNIWDRVEEGEPLGIIDQLQFNEWPPLSPIDTDHFIDRSQQIGSLLPEERPLRIDISPHLGRYAMDLVAYADVSQINSYTFQINLIHGMWGYQQNVMFSYDDGVSEYGNPRTVNNVAQWFGTDYVFISPELDPRETYIDAGWQLVTADHEVELWASPNKTGMASSSSRPTVLVIGKQETDSYMTIFRLANEDILPYQDAILIEGDSLIDNYQLDEIKSFDSLFLYGYDYKNSKKAWDLLSSYVKQGGNLYIDTGWEFWIPEWEFEQAPEVLPLERLTWTDYGMTSDYSLESSVIGGDVDVSKFKPLIWEGQPWTLSGAHIDDVRDWGEVVLSAADRPLIVAGDYGEGRVVWSGMNLVSHARYLGNNEEELKLVHNLVSWLTEEKRGSDLTPPLVKRDHPDLVNFTLDTTPNDITWLYWREAYYPNWHAYLYDEEGEREVPIYRGGPGFMLMPIETSSEEVSVTLRWESSFIESASIVVSIFGVLFLIGIAIDGLVLGGQGLTWIKIAFTTRLPRPFLDEKTHRGAHKKPLKVKDILPTTDEDDHAGGGKTFDATSFEARLNDEEEALMKSWLENKDDEEDPWVNKMLDPDQRK